MPKFVSPKCPYCKHENTFDLEELRRREGVTHKAVETGEEFRVTCSNCGRPFVFQTGKGD